MVWSLLRRFSDAANDESMDADKTHSSLLVLPALPLPVGAGRDLWLVFEPPT